MTIAKDGHTGVSILAGPIRPSTGFPDRIFFMGDSLTITIDGPTARQWIDTLTPIAAKDTE